MPIRFIEPLERAVRRTAELLFRPFDLGKWAVIGFACWLARLAQGGFGSSLGWNLGGGRSEAATGDWRWEDGLAGFLTCGVLAWLLFFLLVVAVVLLWVSSRAKLVFVDDVIHDRSAIAAPWRRYAAQGDSLFVWHLAFIIASLVVVLAALLPLGLYLLPSFRAGDLWPGLLTVLTVVTAIVGLAYIQLFLVDFVVPIMWRYGLTAGAAWGRFLPLLRAHLGHFLVYGLFVLLINVAVGAAVLVAGVLTCCVGLIAVMIPYVGTVLLLPVYTALRLYSVEFLAQLLPDLLPQTELPAGGAEAETAG